MNMHEVGAAECVLMLLVNRKSNYAFNILTQLVDHLEAVPEPEHT